MNLKARGRKRSWPNLKYYPNICLENWEKPYKTQSAQRVSGLRFKPGTFRIQNISLYKVALSPLPPQRFVRSPCWYYSLKETNECEIVVSPQWHDVWTKFKEIRPTVLELKHIDRRTDTVNVLCFYIMHTAQGRHAKTEGWKMTWDTDKKGKSLIHDDDDDQVVLPCAITLVFCFANKLVSSATCSC
jgi:hypothetical protein